MQPEQGWAMVIVNPVSGGGRGREVAKIIKSLQYQIFERTGKRLEIIQSSESGKNSIFNLASRAEREGYGDVMVVGGDGSASLAAKALIFSQTALSIIPTGSGNDFSKALRIPQHPARALEVALSGEIAQLDVGLIDGDGEDIFINAISFGFDARVAQRAAGLKRKYSFLPGTWLYLLALFCQLFSSIEYPRIRVFSGESENGESSFVGEGETLLLAIANGPQYGGMFKIWPGADFADGLLNLCWIKKMGKLRVLCNFLKVIGGTHSVLPEVCMLAAESFSVFSSSELACQADGEILESRRICRISVCPKALRVRTPFLLEPSFEEKDSSRAFFRRRRRQCGF